MCSSLNLNEWPFKVTAELNSCVMKSTGMRKFLFPKKKNAAEKKTKNPPTKKISQCVIAGLRAE